MSVKRATDLRGVKDLTDGTIDRPTYTITMVHHRATWCSISGNKFALQSHESTATQNDTKIRTGTGRKEQLRPPSRRARHGCALYLGGHLDAGAGPNRHRALPLGEMKHEKNRLLAFPQAFLAFIIRAWGGFQPVSGISSRYVNPKVAVPGRSSRLGAGCATRLTTRRDDCLIMI